MTITGSCECGAVVFELSGKLRDVVACHCGQCRKTSGHYWAATSGP
ncbi:GFA family protein, partial [Paracoccaceae bacterium]|nr:GFA family protein [Paracoccaceae bacterium]